MYASWMNDLKEFVSEIVIYRKKIYDHNYLLCTLPTIMLQTNCESILGIFMYLKIDILK